MKVQTQKGLKQLYKRLNNAEEVPPEEKSNKKLRAYKVLVITFYHSL